MNIPIYRAWCEKDSEYAVGFFISDDKENEILTRLDSGEMYARGIDTTTLSIHFPDMLDSQGNKIFASLQDDGKGGDILKGQVYGISKGKVWDMVAEYKDTSIWLTRYINNNPHISMPLVYQKNGYRDMKVIGIKE